jgi:molybdate transport system substrate-binding protein
LEKAKALAALLLSLAAGCSSEQERPQLRVYAATSTRDVLKSLEPVFEARHGVDLVFNFGSSGDLSRQIQAAVQAEVFLSADEREMDRLAAAGLVVEGSRRSLLSNQLAVIEPLDGPAGFQTPFEPGQLARGGVRRLSLADPDTVPAGRYAKAWLERAGIWTELVDRVLPAVDVRAALAAVESGGAQAGVVYTTDAASSNKVRVVFVVPREEGPLISYPVAVIQSGREPAQARAFSMFLSGTEAAQAFEAAGFLIVRE